MANIFAVEPPAWLQNAARPVDTKLTGMALGKLLNAGTESLRHGTNFFDAMEDPDVRYQREFQNEQMRQRREAIKVDMFRARAYEMAQLSQERARDIKMDQALQAMEFKQQLMEDESADSVLYNQAVRTLGTDPEKWMSAQAPDFKTIKYKQMWNQEQGGMLKVKIGMDNDTRARLFFAGADELDRKKSSEANRVRAMWNGGLRSEAEAELAKLKEQYGIGAREFAPTPEMANEDKIAELRSRGENAAADRLEEINKKKGTFASQVEPRWDVKTKSKRIDDLFAEKKQIRAALLDGDIPKEQIPIKEARLKEIDAELIAMDGPAPATAPAPSAQVKQLDQKTARDILNEVGGDKEKARALAKQRGYTF